MSGAVSVMGRLVCGVGTAAMLVGCTNDRRLMITSEPPGAMVYLNDTPVGPTPTEVGFTWFGTYAVRLTKDGYEPLITEADASAPFHEWPGVDLLFMALPGREQTLIDWHFTLEKSVSDDEGLLERAVELRGRAGETE